MTTDDERREVAQRLRKNTGRGMQLILNVAFSAFEFTGCSERTLNADEAALKLADLIDPDLSKNSTVFDGSAAESAVAVKGRTVDCDALLALAEEMVETFRLGAFTGEGLGAKWCRELHDKYTRLIREALGKVENNVQRSAEGWDDC